MRVTIKANSWVPSVNFTREIRRKLGLAAVACKKDLKVFFDQILIMSQCRGSAA